MSSSNDKRDSEEIKIIDIMHELSCLLQEFEKNNIFRMGKISLLNYCGEKINEGEITRERIHTKIHLNDDLLLSHFYTRTRKNGKKFSFSTNVSACTNPPRLRVVFSSYSPYGLPEIRIMPRKYRKDCTVIEYKPLSASLYKAPTGTARVYHSADNKGYFRYRISHGSVMWESIEELKKIKLIKISESTYNHEFTRDEYIKNVLFFNQLHFDEKYEEMELWYHVMYGFTDISHSTNIENLTDPMYLLNILNDQTLILRRMKKCKVIRI